MENIHLFRKQETTVKGITQPLVLKTLFEKQVKLILPPPPPPPAPTHDEDIARLYELLNDFRITKRHKEKNKLKIREAYSIVRRMSFDDQEDFFNNYTFLADKLVYGLDWLQMEAPDSGFVTGLDLNIDRTKDPILGKEVYTNPVLQLLDEDKTYTDPEELRLLLEMTDQVQISDYEKSLQQKKLNSEELDEGELAVLTEVEKKELYISEVAKILARHNYVRPPAPVEEFKRPKLDWYTNLVLGSIKRNWKHPENTGLVATANVFLNPFQWGEQQALIEGFSLYQYQNNTESGGHVYGMRFAEGAEADILLQMDEGRLQANAEKLPFEALHYLGGNVSVHTTKGSINNVKLDVNWPTNSNRKKGEKRHKRNDLVSATIDLPMADMEMHDLRYVSRGKEDQYTVGIGLIKANGIWVKGITRTNQEKNFRTGNRLMAEVTYGVQDASLIITYGILAMIDQMMSVEEKYPAQTMKDYRDMIITVTGGEHTVQMGFKSLTVGDIIHSDYGIIEDMNFGDTTISLKDGASASLEKLNKELEDLQAQEAVLQLKRTLLFNQHDEAGLQLLDEQIALLQDQIGLKQLEIDQQKNKDDKNKIDADVARIELKKLQGELADLYKERAELLGQGQTDLTDIDQKISAKQAAIKTKQVAINDLVKDQQIDFVFETKKADVKNALMIEYQVKKALYDYLLPYGLVDSKGWDDIQFPVGFTLSSSLQTENITGTLLSAPDVYIPFAGDKELGYDFGSFNMTGNNLTIPGIHVNTIIKWTDVSSPMTADQQTPEPPKIQVDFEKLEITAPYFMLNNLTITDEQVPNRNISLAGFTTLTNVKMTFDTVAGRANDYMGGITFSCDSIETMDVGALYLPKKNDAVQAPSGMDFWFREQKGNKLVLNGFSVTHEEPEIVGDATQTTPGKIKDVTRFKFNNLEIGKILAADILASTNITYFESTVENTSDFTRDAENKVVKHDTTSKINLKFGLDALSVPEAGLRTPSFEMLLEPPDMSVKKLQADIGMMERQLNSPELDAKERKKGQFYLDTWRKYLIAAQQKSSALFTGIDVDMEINAFYPENGATQWQNIKVNSFDSGLLEATNLNLIFKDVPQGNDKAKPDSAFHLYGRNTIYGLNVQGVTYDFDKKNLTFDPGGIIAADGTQISLFVSDYLKLTDASTGLLSFQKLTNMDGYAYTLNDIQGMYALGDDMIIGDQETPLSVSGTYDWCEDTGLMTLSLKTTGKIYIPEVVTPDIQLHSVDGVLTVSGIEGDIEVQFKKKKKNGVETDQWFCDSVLFKSLYIGEICSMGLDLKMKTTVLKGTPGEENTISGIQLTNVRFDPQHPGFEDITGTIFAKSADLKNFDMIQAGDIFTLLKGGITGESLTFKQMKRGQFDFSITDPQIFAEQIKAGGLAIDGVNGALNPIFAAGKIEISSALTQKMGNDKITRYGYYVTVTDPFFNEIRAKSEDNLDVKSGEIQVNEVILCGQSKGKITVWIDDPDKNPGLIPQVEIDASGTDFTIEKLDIETPDYTAFKFTDPNAEKEKRATDFALRLQAAGVSAEDFNRVMSTTLYPIGTLQKIEEPDALRVDRSLDKTNGGNVSDETVQEDPDKVIWNKIFAVEYLMQQEEHKALIKPYNFLDQMVGGSVSLTLFGQEIPLNLLRIPAGKPTDMNFEETGGWPADLDKERLAGVPYYTYADIPDFIIKVRNVIGGQFNSFLLWAGTAFLGNEIEEKQLRLTYDYIWDQVYLVTLLEQVTSENLKVITFTHNLFTVPAEVMTLIKALSSPALNTFNQNPKGTDQPINLYTQTIFTRLSAVVASLAYGQDRDSELYAALHPTGLPAEPLGAFTQEQLNNLQDEISRMLHSDMNPTFKINQAIFDMKDKTADEKGILSFVQPKDSDAPLQTNLEISMDQTNRYDYYNIFNYHITRKNLGPQVTLSSFIMPHMLVGSETDKTKTFFESNGLTIDQLKFAIDEYDYVRDYDQTMRDRMANTSKHATLKGQGVTLKGFKLRIPREIKKK